MRWFYFATSWCLCFPAQTEPPFPPSPQDLSHLLCYASALRSGFAILKLPETSLSDKGAPNEKGNQKENDKRKRRAGSCIADRKWLRQLAGTTAVNKASLLRHYLHQSAADRVTASRAERKKSNKKRRRRVLFPYLCDEMSGLKIWVRGLTALRAKRWLFACLKMNFCCWLTEFKQKT